MKNLRRSFLSSNSSILFFPLKIGFIQIRCIFSSSSSSVVSNWKIVFVYLAAAFPLLASVSEIDMRITGNWESDLLLTSHMSVVCSYASDEQTFHSISVKWRREQERVRRCSWKRWASCSKFYWIFLVQLPLLSSFSNFSLMYALLLFVLLAREKFLIEREIPVSEDLLSLSSRWAMLWLKNRIIWRHYMRMEDKSELYLKEDSSYRHRLHRRGVEFNKHFSIPAAAEIFVALECGEMTTCSVCYREKNIR